MKEKTIKSAFVSGTIVNINGQLCTRMHTQEDIEARKNNPATQISSEEMDKRMEQNMKEMFPDFHKKLHPEQYKD